MFAHRRVNGTGLETSLSAEPYAAFTFYATIADLHDFFQAQKRRTFLLACVAIYRRFIRDGDDSRRMFVMGVVFFRHGCQVED